MPKNTQLGQALYEAVKNNRYAEAEILLKADAATYWVDPSTGNTALHCAALNNFTDLALLLLTYDANISSKNLANQTPIVVAAEKKYWDFITKFAAARRSTSDCQYGNALLSAAASNQLVAVQSLLAAGTDTTWHYVTTLNTSLHCAANNNNPQMIRSLILAGANQTALNSDKETPITIATKLAESRENGWESVMAFAKNYRPKDIPAFTITDLGKVIREVSRENINTNNKQIYFSTSRKIAASKDAVLKQILAIKNPELKQKALWQALDPETLLGKIFYLQRGWRKPSINAGRLKKIATELTTLLKTQPVDIDKTVFENIYHNPAIIKSFPQLMPDNPVTDLISVVTAISPKDLHDQNWAKAAYGNDNGANKDKVLNQIKNMENPDLKQKALWQALEPDTYLGYIFHIKRSWFSPSYITGRLRAIVQTISQLLLGQSLSIDESIEKSLSKKAEIGRLLRSNTAAPPAYHAISISSTGQIMQAGFKPNPYAAVTIYAPIPIDAPNPPSVSPQYVQTAENDSAQNTYSPMP